MATLRPPGGWRGPEARTLLDRFGGVALIAFLVTAMTGVLRASDQVHDFSGLWTTSYGVVLALKSTGVAIMLVLSVLAWRRGLPVARLEAVLAALVIAATAVLASFPIRA
jgi:putative copper export protein